jgi:hypothetical protein
VRHREDGLIISESPGGFPFCLVRWEGEAEPPAPVSATSTACLADQLCLDVPPGEGFERELRFWAALLDLVPPDPGVGGRLHVAAGARVVAQDAWWTVLTDPAGRQYCLVARPVASR